MEPMSPEDWWPLFQRAMHDGDLDVVLRLYEPGAVFASATGEILAGHDALRTVLGPLANARADSQFSIRKIIQNGDLALVHSDVRTTRPQATSGCALEVLRRQSDGSWLLAIGDPFTIRQRSGPRAGE
jgi:ketosteroid isomerase-like protein